MPARHRHAALVMSFIQTVAVLMLKTANPNQAHVKQVMSMPAPATHAVDITNAQQAIVITLWLVTQKMSVAEREMQICQNQLTIPAKTAQLRAKPVISHQEIANNSNS